MGNKIYSFKIEGETPAKKNANKISFKTKRTYKTKVFKNWHESALAQIRLFGDIPETPIETPVFIYIKFIHGDYVRRDSDNQCSSVMDLLMDAGVLKDDNWKIVKSISIKNEYKKNDAYCEITIQEL